MVLPFLEQTHPAVAVEPVGPFLSAHRNGGSNDVFLLVGGKRAGRRRDHCANRHHPMRDIIGVEQNGLELAGIVGRVQFHRAARVARHTPGPVEVFLPLAAHADRKSGRVFASRHPVRPLQRTADNNLV